MRGNAQKIAGFSTNTSENPCAIAGYSTSMHSTQLPSGSLYEIPATITSHPDWKAFQAGMKILQRYASRSPIDAHNIAKSNLRLLHHSLSQDKNFTRIIKKAQRESMKSHLPTLQHLRTEQGAWADLLTLQDGDSISLEELSQPDTMYLVISGSAQLKNTNDHLCPTQRWWNHLGITKNRGSLRRGDVISSTNTDEQQSLRILTAAGKTCLLLRVRTISQTTSKVPQTI